MKNAFPGYYRPTQEEFSVHFKECVFSFDTNVLLNLYRFTPDSRDELLKVLQHPKIKDRVWLPHQVGYEYHDNRIEVIIGQREMYGSLKKAVDKAIAIFEDYRRSGNFQITALIEPIRKGLEQVKADLEKKKADHPDLLNADPIRDTLTTLFNGKVGPEYPPEEHKKKLTLAKARFEGKTPPGYLDSTGRKKKEGDRKYGDVLIWFQLIDFAKNQNKPIILITDETGEDWWLKDDRTTLGPRPELLQEMHKETGRWFYMYSTEQFLQRSRDLLQLDVKPNVIKEAKEIKEEDEERMHTADPKSGGVGSALDPQIGGLRFPLSGVNLDLPRIPVVDMAGVIPKMPDLSSVIPRVPDFSGVIPNIPDLSAALAPVIAASGVIDNVSRAMAPLLDYQRRLEKSTSGLASVADTLRRAQEAQERLMSPLGGIAESLQKAQEAQERLMNPFGGVTKSLQKAQEAQERLMNPFGGWEAFPEGGAGGAGAEQEGQGEEQSEGEEGQKEEEEKPKE